MVHIAPQAHQEASPSSSDASSSQSSQVPSSQSSQGSSQNPPSSLEKHHTFHPPTKRILTPEHLLAFQQSPTHSDIVRFIDALNEAVRGVKLRDGEGEGERIPVIQALLHILDEVESLAHSTPPLPNAASRFGNPAFRSFYDKVSSLSSSLHETYLVPLGLPREAVEEVSVYFREMWGNRTRIDYGSGMELNWVCWVVCLWKLGVLEGGIDGAGEGMGSTANTTTTTTASTNDTPSPSPTQSTLLKFLVTRVFWRYISVMRTLQSTYWLEPAGSHGVWGLDDYHFLPFLWGSGQLVGHKWIRPRAIHDEEVVEEYGSDWMYFGCVGFINSIKTASLRWHSPMLDDISAVKTWDKVNSGMKKMYLAEVLGKLPVMQHFLFGSLLPFPSLPSRISPSSTSSEATSEATSLSTSSSTPSSEANHAHDHKPGEACGHTHAPRTASGIHPRVLASLKARGEAVPGAETEADTGGAGQRDVGWGDCCGIAVPSVFGAAAAAAAESGSESGGGQVKGGYKLSGVRPVPFD